MTQLRQVRPGALTPEGRLLAGIRPGDPVTSKSLNLREWGGGGPEEDILVFYRETQPIRWIYTYRKRFIVRN